jgi:protein-L-isoaspartate(D-aspartate) O-methyltransferase
LSTKIVALYEVRLWEQSGTTSRPVGYEGWPERAPFTKIIVTASPEVVPQTLVDQLAVDGRMVVPVGPQYGNQELRILTKTTKGVVSERSLPVRFVPMVKPKER